MKTEEKKVGLLAEVRQAREQVLQAASSLPAEQRGKVFLGTWSVRDILAHLAGWDAANLEALGAIQAGRLPAFYAEHDRGWVSLNARLVAEHAREEWDELVEHVRESHKRLLEAVEGIEAAVIYKDYGVRFRGYRVTIARLLEAEVRDEREHAAQVRDLGTAI